MGRVFRFSEVVSGKTPSPSDFRVGKDDIVQTLTAATDVIGAILCGSVVHGGANLRSDIDVVVYHHDTAAFQAAIGGLRRRCALSNLELSLVKIDPALAASRFHTISYGYYQHLVLAARQGGLIKQNFLPLLNRRHMHPHDDIAEYVSFKLRYLGKAVDELADIDIDSEKHTDILQKALEVPVHIARKVCWLSGASTGDDSKASVVAAYAQVAPPALGRQLQHLVAVDRLYTQELQRQIAEPDAGGYRLTLHAISRELPVSMRFVRENALAMDLETASLTPATRQPMLGV